MQNISHVCGYMVITAKILGNGIVNTFVRLNILTHPFRSDIIIKIFDQENLVDIFARRNRYE